MTLPWQFPKHLERLIRETTSPALSIYSAAEGVHSTNFDLSYEQRRRFNLQERTGASSWEHDDEVEFVNGVSNWDDYLEERYKLTKAQKLLVYDIIETIQDTMWGKFDITERIESEVEGELFFVARLSRKKSSPPRLVEVLIPAVMAALNG